MGSKSIDITRPNPWPTRLSVLAAFLAALAAVVGLVVLVGWVLDLPGTRELSRGGITMKFNAALGVALAGVTAILVGSRHSMPPRPWRVAAGKTGAAIVLAIGALTLFEHISGVSLGIDEILWRDSPGGTDIVNPGRMGPPGAICLTLIGLALLLVDARPQGASRITPSQALGAIVFALAALPMIGYVYGVNELNTLPRITEISLHSAAAFLAMGASIVLLRPQRGIARVLSRADDGAAIIRRLLPAALVLPVVIGWLVRRGNIAGWYGISFEMALLAFVAVLLFSVVVWLIGGALSRKAAAQAQAESRKTAVFQSALDAMVTMDRHGRVVEWNPAAEEKFGYARSEALGKTVAELIIPPDWRAAHSAGLRRILDAAPSGPLTGRVVGQRVQATAINKAGAPLEIEMTISATRLGDDDVIFNAYLRDVTDQKAAASERALLAAIVESSDDAIISKTLDGTITSWNSAAERIFGYTGAEAIGRSITMIIPPERADEERIILDRLGRGQRIDHFQTVRLAKDGRRVDVALTVSPVRDGQGRIIGASKVARDVTQQKRNESALSHNALLLSAVREGLVVTDLRGIVTHWNQGATDLLGWTEEEMVGSYLPDRIPEPRRRQVADHLIQMAEGKLEWDGEYQLSRKDGSTIWLYTRVHRFNDAQGRPAGIIAVSHDISSRRKVEEELRIYREKLEQIIAERTSALAELNRRARQSERLAALGTLAAGLGHDLANLLLPVRTRLEVLEGMPLPAEAREDLAATRSALGYVQRLSTGLRLMSADPDQQASTHEPTDLGQWWLDIEGVLKTVLPRDVVLQSELVPGLAITMPRHHLTQAVFNLVQNAGEAISSANEPGGVVRISARATNPPDGDEQPLPPVVEIDVTDNGPGMPPETFARCFEPYFSTKARAISTGMGLALVRGLVERAGGNVLARSTVGAGTTFTIVLPAAIPLLASRRGTHRPTAVVSPLLGQARARTEALAAAFLESLGVTVRRAPVPDEADIWVAQSPDMQLVHDFLAGGPGRCVVLCDEPPLEPSPGLFECVTFVGQAPRASDLRRAIIWAVSRAVGPPPSSRVGRPRGSMVGSHSRTGGAEE